MPLTSLSSEEESSEEEQQADVAVGDDTQVEADAELAWRRTLFDVGDRGHPDLADIAVDPDTEAAGQT